MFVNNYYIPFAKARPPFVRVENDAEYGQFYATQIDTFDNELYETNLKLKSGVSVEGDMPKSENFKYRHSLNIHEYKLEDFSGVETFDNLSNTKPFVSKPKNVYLRYKYKIELNKIYKHEKQIKSKTGKIEFEVNEIIDLHLINRRKKSVNYNERKQLQYARLSKELIKKENQKIDQKVKFDSDIKKTEIANDSIFTQYQEDIFIKRNSSRPKFVEDLFKKYDYENIDPWKKVQVKTKDKSLCISVIQDIYHSIKNYFS